MPRLTVEPSNEDDTDAFDEMYEDVGQGSDLFDLCSGCASDWECLPLDSDSLPEWLTLSIDTDLGFLLVDIEEHPKYDCPILGPYYCCACRVRLADGDD